MQKRLITILLFFFSKSVLSFSAGRSFDPIALALEQILSDITFEIVPCPTYPNVCPNIYYDTPNQYGPYNPNLCMNPYDQFWPCGSLDLSPYDQCMYGPNICYDQCFDTYPSCNCYRDIKNPCSVYDDSSLYICFDHGCGCNSAPNYGCGCNSAPNYGCGCNSSPAPYIYFPEVEYPMSAMDFRPYYYGSCWCS